MLNKEQYPAIRVSVYFPSMIEEFYGDNIEILQVIDSTNKKVGFESIIGQRTHSNEKNSCSYSRMSSICCNSCFLC